MIETARLVLRRWRPEDQAPYAAIMGDPRVADWLGGAPSVEDIGERIERLNAALDRQGFGRLAIERREDGRLIGHCGLMPVGPALPEAGGVEIGWALAPDAWGRGYAAEAARAVLDDGFARLGLGEIVAFTTTGNLRSQAVMGRLGMARRPERDFDHPMFAKDHPLCRHVVYVAARPA